MPLRVTGMNSGLDTDSIIAELVKAKRVKVDNKKKAQTKLQWQQDKWKELNTKLLNLYNKTVSNMRYTTAFQKKTTLVSNKDAVSVITGENAVNGVQEVQVKALAKTGYLTGADLSKDGKRYGTGAKLSDLDPDYFGEGKPGADGATLTLKVGGRTTEIKVDGNTRIADVVDKLQNAGVNANFDVKSQRFFISSKKSGSAGDFTLTASDEAGNNALKALGLNTSLKDDTAALAEYEKWAAYVVKDDATGVIDKAQTLDKMRSVIDQEIQKRLAGYKSENETLSKNITAYREAINKLKDDPDYPKPEDYPDGITVKKVNEKITAKQAEIDQLAEDMKDMTGDELTAAEERMSKLKEEKTTLDKQLNLLEARNTYRTKITEAEDKIAENLTHFELDADGKPVTDADGKLVPTAEFKGKVEDSLFDKAVYADKVITDYNDPNSPKEAGATRIAGQDAKLILNGAEFTSSNNVFDINGLTITAQKETEEAFTITTQDDTDGIYDVVKNFLKEYNDVVKEMDKLYNAESSKGYEPLTDEEKDELSDKEIEKWEEKIKDSILRRDENLGNVSSSIKAVMSAGIEVGGKTMYLSDFGINTLGYFNAPDNEKYLYHIDGDPDDSNTSGKPDKLKAMIASDPSKVTEFFTGLSKNLYKTMEKLSSRVPGYRSYNSFFYDQKMKSDYEDYNSKIKDMEKKVTAYEDRWYNKFSAMETALAKLQSNESAISGLLGG